MKSNEAPEKIYVVDATFPDYVDFDGSPINTKRIDDHDIEYTRTNAIIERVAIWFNECFITHDEYGVISTQFDTEEEMFEDFKNHMKGG